MAGEVVDMLEHAERRPPVLRRPLAEPVDAIGRRQPADGDEVQPIPLVVAEQEVAIVLHPARRVPGQRALCAGPERQWLSGSSNSYQVTAIWPSLSASV
jgi:hypothetical protein